jgi:hypothetical protein
MERMDMQLNMRAFLASKNGGRYRTRTYDPLRVNYAKSLYFIVFEANLGIRAWRYFSFKNLFWQIVWKPFVPN